MTNDKAFHDKLTQKKMAEAAVEKASLGEGFTIGQILEEKGRSFTFDYEDCFDPDLLDLDFCAEVADALND